MVNTVRVAVVAIAQLPSIFASGRILGAIFKPCGTVAWNTCAIVVSMRSNGMLPMPQPISSKPEERITVAGKEIAAFDGSSLGKAERTARRAAFEAEVASAVAAAGYPPRADPARINKPAVLGLLTVLVILVAMVYGPIAAQLVELFPTRIRYTALSLPYHIGNGWFGGFLPITAFAIVAATGNIYAGLMYPIIVAAMTFILGVLFIRETRGRDIIN